MKGVHGKRKASELSSGDIISSMPDNVIANVMNRLPIRDAVRTTILAKNWRLKWTLLTQLIFDYGMSKPLVTLGPEGKKYYDSRIISRLLLVLKGPITMFFLYIDFDRILDVGDLNHWVLFLSGKGIKEFTLNNTHHIPLRLPIHLFSCLQLTHLDIGNCLFNPPPTFCGFPNLLSLVIRMVRFERCKCGELITRSPLLKILEVFGDCDDYALSKINLDGIAKLKNLKKLYLSLREVENRVIFTTSSIFQFLGFLPKLAVLYLDFLLCEFVAEDVARKWVPTVFTCLKTLALYDVDFGRVTMLSCVFRLIWGSQNLQELKLSVSPLSRSTGYEFYIPPIALLSSGLDSNMVGQLQLQSVKFKDFSGSKNEVCLMRYLLACSPFLKRVAVYSVPSLESDEKLQAAKELLKLERASPVARIDFYEHEFE